MKVEDAFYPEGSPYTTTVIVEQTVRDYITYYNLFRIQTKLNHQSPIDSGDWQLSIVNKDGLNEANVEQRRPPFLLP
ncbi:hypothetical protein BBD40_06400 [Paenibacillus ihbetae]|uniref:Integrase catalytic domain-containing protein n=1 Tax=Paenibacillus ihbetae TaxID=1870820 RepID=A0ABX3JY46_9BACL|nr:hypothetical protein BBD40_06400 [Paenibacillus ihbetae]